MRLFTLSFYELNYDRYNVRVLSFSKKKNIFSMVPMIVCLSVIFKPLYSKLHSLRLKLNTEIMSLFSKESKIINFFKVLFNSVVLINLKFVSQLVL